MKIAIVGMQIFPTEPNPDKYTGAEWMTGLLAKYLDDHAHEVHLFAPLGSFQPKHGFLYSTGQPGTMSEIDAWKIYMATPASKKALLDADIIHDATWSFCAYSLYSDKNGKIIKTWHGPDAGFKEKPPFPKVNFCGVSHNHAKYLSQITGLTYRGVQNGIDLSRYPFKKEKQDYLLWVSRIFAPKGCHRFIDICEKLQMKGYILGGSFGQDPDYVALIKKKLENSKYVAVVGTLGEAVPFEKKLEMFQNAKAVVLPVKESYTVPGTNRIYNFIEPFGLIAVESQAVGTPFIVTPSGGWNETTIHGKTGYFANSDDEFEFAIKRVLNGEIKPENCRKHAEWFSYERMATEYLHLYKEISEGRGW